MSSEGHRRALIVASSDFTDPTLGQLISPANDATALANVLEDPSIGNFEISLLENRPSHEARVAIEDFFADGRLNDLLLLYFSGHGVKGDDGRLYLATTDTECKRLRSKTVPASFINDNMSASRSRQQILILDCCYSGAFARGMIAKGDTVDIRSQFEGRGRVVLTASSATQYAFQGQDVTGTGCRSVFTRYLVRGLETGEADLNGDGRVSIDELYDYVHAHVIQDTPQQTPGRWTFDFQGDIFIARSPLGSPNRVRKEALLTSLLRNRPALHYLDVAERAGMDLDGLLQNNLGAILEQFVHQTVAQDLRQIKPTVTGPTPEKICRLLSYLSWVLFSEQKRSCQREQALSIIHEALEGLESVKLDVERALDAVTSTRWVRAAESDRIEFQDEYILAVLTAMELKARFPIVQAAGVLSSGPNMQPRHWQRVIILLSGMLTQEQAMQLVEALIETELVELVNLAGWCIAEGQPIPQAVVARVIDALVARSEREGATYEQAYPR